MSRTDRLSKLLGLLGSDHAGEHGNAVAAIQRELGRLGVEPGALIAATRTVRRLSVEEIANFSGLVEKLLVSPEAKTEPEPEPVSSKYGPRDNLGSSTAQERELWGANEYGERVRNSPDYKAWLAILEARGVRVFAGVRAAALVHAGVKPPAPEIAP